MQTRLLTVAMVVIAVSAAVGMSAFTTGEVTRSSNVDVVNDDVGLLGLVDGNSGDLVQKNGTGALTIDFTRGGKASGVNTAATFELGDPAAPGTTQAFNITNNDASSRDLTISYDIADDTNTAANIQFRVYDKAGTEVANVTDETTSDTITGAASGATYAVVIVVDTHGLDTTANLSGTLKVSA